MPAIQLGERLAIAFGDSSDQQVVWRRGFAHIPIQPRGEKSSRQTGLRVGTFSDRFGR
jgi:hypothetical protein